MEKYENLSYYKDMQTMESEEDLRARCKQKLASLINRYNKTFREINSNDISEETIRTWLNEFLLIFGWDVQNPKQVIQEKNLQGAIERRLDSINSPHKKPDYILVNGKNIKTFIDAKSLSVNIFTDKEVAYQIRSYGWSAKVPCAFVSNFEQFVIYDTRFVPSPDQPADYGIKKLSVNEYLDNFNLLYEHLEKMKIYSNNLEKIYSAVDIEGKEIVDFQFMQILSSFRTRLAQNLIKNNSSLKNNDTELNYYVQVIMDRIIFIRVCESKHLEEQEKLKKFKLSNNGFWKNFKNSCYMEFYEHYDGAMFSKDKKFQTLKLDDYIFSDFIDSLYYPNPYKFDVIPIEVIANIYEEFLGKKLTVNNGKVKEIFKSEYVKTNGAIPTPAHIVKLLVSETIELSRINSIEDLLNIKILDPCCGSGIFLITCFDLLSNKMVEIFRGNPKEKDLYSSFLYVDEDVYYLTIAGRTSISKNCIYGLDIDEAAIEVTKMSLALKVVDGDNPVLWDGLGAFGARILNEIADNIKMGNTLVGLDNIFEANQIDEIKPINIKNIFNDVFDPFGGFSYVLGNPPYVETKHYKSASPEMHSYLSEKYNYFEGKADLVVLFIERCLKLLSENGVLGFIVQRRWFKTDYGRKIRLLINKNKKLKKIIDFKSTDIFKGRIVYSSILLLSNIIQDNFEYFYSKDSVEKLKLKIENDDFYVEQKPQNIPIPKGDSSWNFEHYEIELIKRKLTEKIGTVEDFPKLEIKDGIQALWKKVYHLKNVTFSNNIGYGKNGFNEDVAIETDLLKGVIYNRSFYPFKEIEPNAYCLFPYQDASNIPIEISEIESKYPLAYKYLHKNEGRIKQNVKCVEGEYWYTFTREHNQNLYYVDKIIMPMTARDTIATFVSEKGLYMDNSNVWFITIPDADKNIMKAITCVINSTVFSVLGKAGANPQKGDYYKFNKQFIKPIPFPSSKILNDSSYVNRLALFYDEIFELQNKYKSANNNYKEIFSSALEQKWNNLDDVVYELYELTKEERCIINEEGRSVNRIELLNEG